MTTTLRLNLGCSDRAIPGFVGVDIAPGPCVDQIVDLSKQRIRIDPNGDFEIYYVPWPWGDSTVEEIRAHDVLEHFRGDGARAWAFNEMWRVLKPGGRAMIEVPSAVKGSGYDQDPTHRQPYAMNSFQYFRNGSFAHNRLAAAYGITARFNVLSLEERKYQDEFEEVYKITAILEAVK